ncbi:PTPRA [Branchiostoma lanceolatum]|uniref:Receptor-type tyrosine-protein phosphatase alpha n=1 Tax=Branchiostoma lanceolatum TaxID=7740 RepID=A0A8J9YWM9_BRALA|nr:PTPRA [Branchiostoma lanceolatum]
MEGRGALLAWTLILVLHTTEGVVDVTVVSKFQFFEELADTWLYCYYTGSVINQNRYSFGIEVNTGAGRTFTKKRNSGGSDGAKSVKIWDESRDFRVGAFSCQVKSSDGTIEKAITLKMKSEADVWPADFTVTANIGDPVTLQMEQKSDRTGTLEWRKDGTLGSVLDGQNELNLSIASVQPSDEGIYECYYQGFNDGKQGIMRLIVRGCPENKWGPSCAEDCPVCYNGGVCDDSTGECVCPPGFHGFYCESACADNKIGTTCTRQCTDGDCTGQLLCVTDPYGCSCAAGLMGIECTTVCPEGWYGAGCTQTCHCAEGPSACNIRTGACTGGCQEFWTGESCQIADCNTGTFCLHGGTCSSTYNQLDCSCTGGWEGDRCEIDKDECAAGDHNCEDTCVNTPGSYTCTCGTGSQLAGDGHSCISSDEVKPTVSPLPPPDSNSVKLTWSLHTEDFSGDIKYYLIKYSQTSGPAELQTIRQTSDNIRPAVVGGLQVFTNYTFSVQAVLEEISGEWSEPILLQTEPGVPSVPRNVRLVNVSWHQLELTWGRPELVLGPYINYKVDLYRPGGLTWVWDHGRQNYIGTSLIIDRLDPATEYRVEIKSYNGKYPSEEVFVEATTSDGYPTAPEEVQKNDTDAACQVMWSPPEKSHGTITKYTVYYTWNPLDGADYSSFGDRVEVSPTANSVTLLKTGLVEEQLKPNANYSITVAASTYTGQGNHSQPVYCTVPPGKPAKPKSPVPILDNITSTTFPLALQPASQQYGPVQCYHVVVVEMDAGVGVNDLPSAELLEVRGYQETTQTNQRPPYSAYVTAAWDRNSLPQTVNVGDGSRTSCAPVSRRKRDKQDTSDWIYSETFTNRPLSPGMAYTAAVRVYGARPKDGSQPHFSTSSYIDPLATNNEAGFIWTNIWPIVGVVIAVLLLIAICITLTVCLMRKRSSHKKAPPPVSDIPTSGGTKRTTFNRPGDITLADLDPPAAYSPIPLDRLEEEYNKRHANDDQLFKEEYETLPQKLAHSHNAFSLPENKVKNRFANILPYDRARVVLSTIEGQPGSDYINASFIDQGYDVPNKFIASQGPRKETVSDFWRMVWEQNSATVVMVTNLAEKSKAKCHQYWPEEGVGQYGDVSVEVTDVVRLVDFVIRTLTVEHLQLQEFRTITQFHFTSWPDFGVPQSPLGMMKFVKRVKMSNPVGAGPIIVHCSAGVGRTGTFIVIDTLIDMMAAEQKVDVFGCVARMRHNRSYMVQTEAQYIFIYQSVLEHHLYGDTELEVANMHKYMHRLHTKQPGSNLTGMETEFKNLTKIPIEKHHMRSGNLPDNISKNRVLQVLPYDTHRVYIPAVPGLRNSDYINASFMNGYRQKDAFIATQGPLAQTVADFWSMIWEWRTCSIVMLTELVEKGRDQCTKYWSDTSNTYRDVTVELYSLEKHHDYTLRTFHISNCKSKDQSCRTVQQFQFHGWPDVGAPNTAAGMLDLIGQVQKQQQVSGNGPITVHCSSGAGRTGTFIALCTILERVKTEGICDVFQTVKALRQQRPHMVQTQDQYNFCYRAVIEYLDSFDMYANFK